MTARHPILCALVLAFALAPLPVSHASRDTDTKRPKEPQNLPACIHVETQARFVMGYDHLVHIESSCDSVATCAVFTNVNPEVHTVTVAPKKRETVLTYRGSPARSFEAHVQCRLATEP